MDIKHPPHISDITKSRYNKRFIHLLISLLTLLFGSLFIPTKFTTYLYPIFLLQFTFTGLILFRNHRKAIYRLIVVIIFFLLLFEGLKFTSFSSRWATLLSDLTYIGYFVITSLEVFRQILLARRVDFNMLAGSFCGFIMLAIIGSFMLSVIEVTAPGSFSGINVESFQATFQDLIYYSFVSILTIGYGDILPISDTARKASVLLGVVGYFYNIFVIGITISKFMLQSSFQKKDNNN